MGRAEADGCRSGPHNAREQVHEKDEISSVRLYKHVFLARCVLNLNASLYILKNEGDMKLITYSTACALAELVCNIQTHISCMVVRVDHDAGSVPERELLSRYLCMEHNRIGAQHEERQC